ncbi:MAG: SRPBCC domain-containing protein [Alphaproteobacteria bacterium]|nr:SRPBCC domain-containing protein [Alphaproteobacteria bacterium]
MTQDYPEFIITRTVNAPRTIVFKAWSDLKILAKWWGPRGFETPVCEGNVREEGKYRMVMRSPDGVDYPIKGIYLEVEKPERLVMTQDCSEHPAAWHDMVKPNRAKNDKNPAGELLTSVTFEEISGKTKITICIYFDTLEIRDAMLKMGMNDGWSQSLDRLEEYLKIATS